MDLASLDRLSDQTRHLIDGTDEPLLKLFYWKLFLSFYLDSGINAPVYLADCLPGLTGALQTDGLSLYDPIFLDELRRLAGHPSIPGDRMSGDFRQAATSYRIPSFAHRAMREAPGRELTAGIILVTKGRALWNQAPTLGVPETLHMRATRGFVAPGQISWHGRLVPGDEIQVVATEALAAAIRTCSVRRPLLSYELRTGHPEWPLVGSSLGLALAALFAAFESAERKKPHKIPVLGSVICGATSPDGAILPVAPATIRQKVIAAAGAGITRFVLPAANAADAQAELDRLSRRLPEISPPRLLPVEHLRDLLDDAEALTAPPRSARRLVRRSRRFPLAAALVLALLIASWTFLLRPRPWAAERTSVEIQGQTRQVVATTLSGFPPRQKQWRFKSPVAAATVADLQPASEAALIVGTEVGGLTPAHLFCYDIGSGRLLWDKDLTHPADLPKPTEEGNRIHVSELVATDLDSDGFQDLIVTVLANPQSPCFVFWLGPDGAARAMYAHRGYLFQPRVEDLWMNGNRQLFLIGTSNSDDEPYSQRATVVVLDKDHFAGWPDGGPFLGSTTASFDSSFARIVFPPIPEHCQIYDAPGYFVRHFETCPSTTDPRIIVGVGPATDPGVSVTLDGDFRPKQVLAEDGLSVIAQRALKAGRIASDFSTLARMIEYTAEIHFARDETRRDTETPSVTSPPAAWARH